MLAIREALEFPFRGTKWPQRLLLGGILSALPMLAFTFLGYWVDVLKSASISTPFCLLYLPIWGYIYNIFRAALHEEAAQLLTWGHWGDLLSKGFLVFVLTICYGLFPFLTIAVGIGILYRGGWWLFTGLLLMMIGMLALLLVSFFFPMGMAQYARWRRIEAAFHFPFLLRSISRVLVEYVSLFLISLLVLLAMGFISTIPVLGLALAAFLGFYPFLVFAKLFGDVCHKSSEKE